MAGHVFDVQFDTVGDGLVENADMRIYGYADIKLTDCKMYCISLICN